jgi:hypothetical protein
LIVAGKGCRLHRHQANDRDAGGMANAARSGSSCSILGSSPPVVGDWAAGERHLLLLSLCLPDARPLPPVFAEVYGRITIGDRCGIIRPGAPLRAA